MFLGSRSELTEQREREKYSPKQMAQSLCGWAREGHPRVLTTRIRAVLQFWGKEHSMQQRPMLCEHRVPGGALAHDAHQTDFLFRDLSWHFTNTTAAFPLCRRDTFSLEQKITLWEKMDMNMASRTTTTKNVQKCMVRSRLFKSHTISLISCFTTSNN